MFSRGGTERADHCLRARQRHRQQLRGGDWGIAEVTAFCKEPGGSLSRMKMHTLKPDFQISITKNVAQGPEDAEESWRHEHENEKEDSIAQLQVQIQQLERENTEFLAALEDAMEQYKQQVGCRQNSHSCIFCSSCAHLSCFLCLRVISCKNNRT